MSLNFSPYSLPMIKDFYLVIKIERIFKFIPLGVPQPSWNILVLREINMEKKVIVEGGIFEKSRVRK